MVAMLIDNKTCISTEVQVFRHVIQTGRVLNKKLNPIAILIRMNRKRPLQNV